MSVNVTISNTSEGVSVSDTYDCETIDAGDNESFDFYVRHDAQVNPLTDCCFYISRFVGDVYNGDDPDDDISEILGWGDSSDGLAISFDDGANYTYFSNTVGYDGDTAIELDGVDTAGELAVDEEAHIKLKFEIPDTVSRGAGIRNYSLVFAYSATS